MSPPSRLKGESLSAQREGRPIVPPSRLKGESLSAQRGGLPILPPGRLKGESLSAQREGRAVGRLPLLAGLVAALLFAAPVAAQFKWTDADGRVVYGDSPPRDARNIERLGLRGPAARDPLLDLPFELRRTVESFPVVLYSARDCTPCAAARRLLLGRGVPFTERLIASPEDFEQFKRLGFGTEVPVITVGRRTQRAFEPNELNALLDEAGYPRESRLPRNWQPAEARPLVEPAPAAAAATTDDAEAPAPRRPRRTPAPQ
jgi:hypothetical protein